MARKGERTPNETRHRMSEARKGRPLTEAHKRAIGEARRGKPWSEEARAWAAARRAARPPKPPKPPRPPRQPKTKPPVTMASVVAAGLRALRIVAAQQTSAGGITDFLIPATDVLIEVVEGQVVDPERIATFEARGLGVVTISVRAWVDPLEESDGSASCTKAEATG